MLDPLVLMFPSLLGVAILSSGLENSFFNWEHGCNIAPSHSLHSPPDSSLTIRPLVLCYAPTSFEMIVGNLILSDPYSTLWPSTMLGCYNFISLGLRTRRVCRPSAGIRLSGKIGFRHFLHRPKKN